MKIRHILPLITTAVLAFHSAAADTDPVSEAVASILSNNPALKAEVSRLRSESLAISAENLLSDPEVDFDYKIGHAGAPDKWGVTVSQAFDWPGLYSSRRRAARASEDAFGYLRRSAVMEKALEARLLIIDFVKVRRRLSLLNEVAGNVDSLLASSEKAFSHGETTILDIRKLRLQSQVLKADIADQEAVLDGLRADITAMNGGSYINTSALDSYPSETLLPEEEYMALYTDSDPGILGLDASARAAAESARAERLKRMPGFKVGYIHEREGTEDFNGFTVGVSLPVWSRKSSAALAAAQSAVAENLAADYRLTRQAALVADYSAAKRLERRATMFEEVVNGEKSYPDLLLKAYDGGRLTLIQYLQELNWYIESRMTADDYRYRYAQALARLNRIKHADSLLSD